MNVEPIQAICTALPMTLGRVSPWTARLDTLARELDIVIIVSAENRIVEPAAAVVAITVSSLAHANGLPTDSSGGTELSSITSLNFPAPVTRSSRVRTMQLNRMCSILAARFFSMA